ncbi:MAG: PorV/PorQ family protein [Bacteroidota bacterium]
MKTLVPLRRFGAFLVIQLCIVGFLEAQSKTGTTIGQFLLIEPSARLSAMGNAGVATFDEVIAAYYNPGVLGHVSSSHAQFTHSLWIADIAYNYAGVGIKLAETRTLYLSMTSLNSGEIDVRTVERPLGTGERYTVSNVAFGIGYGQRITDRFSAGLQVSYIQETIWHSSLGAFALNFGTLYQLSPDGIHIGASISNFGTRGRYTGRDLRIRYDLDPDRYGDNSNLPGEVFTEEFSLPVIFRVGLAFPLALDANNRFQFAIDAFHPNDNTESVSFGVEWNFMGIVSLRGGYQNLYQKDAEVGPTAGAGLEYGFLGTELRVDYAWAGHGRLKETHRFTVGVAF